jgi:hypothetical protein
MVVKEMVVGETVVGETEMGEMERGVTVVGDKSVTEMAVDKGQRGRRRWWVRQRWEKLV